MPCRRLVAISLLLAAGCRSRAAPPSPPTAVAVHGVLREIMHGGSAEGRVALAEAVGPTTIAVGALDGLRGEVTVLDGAVHRSAVIDGAVVSERGPGDARAALLVIASVPAWRAIELTEPIAADRFDEAIAARLGAAGVTGPTPFVIEGELTELRWHVVDGPHQHGAPSGLSRDQPGRAVIVGFHSTEHEGVFTHMGQTTHAHVITADATGHVDRIAVAAGAVLRLPR